MGLLGAIKDQQFRGDVRQGLLDAVNRGGVAGLLGMPVDTVAGAMKAVGYDHPMPVGGSDWLCHQMQKAGLLGDKRNQTAEQWANVAAMLATMRPDAALKIK